MSLAAAAVPIVCDVPHCGRAYPGLLDDEVTVGMRMTEDRYADRFYAPLKGYAHAWHQADVARTIIDVNRPRDDRAFRQAALDGTPLNRGLDQSVREKRLTNWYDPYLSAVHQMIDTALETHEWVVHLNLHTFPATDWHTPGHPPMPFDVEIGDRWSKTSPRGLGARLTDAMSLAGYSVARNDTFAGGQIVRNVTERHGPAVESVQVEVSRALYLDDGLDVSPEKLARHQEKILGVIVESVASMATSEEREEFSCTTTSG